MTGAGHEIALDSDVASARARSLRRGAAELPSSQVVARVVGDGDEPITEEFRRRLQQAASTLGAQVDALSGFVQDHADALERTVRDMADTDARNKAAAKALVDGIVTAAPAATSTGAGAGGAFADLAKQTNR